MVNDHYPYEKWLFHWEYSLFSDTPNLLGDGVYLPLGPAFCLDESVELKILGNERWVFASDTWDTPGIAKWGAHPSRASAYGLMFVGRNSIPSQCLRCSDLTCLYDMTKQVQVHKWLTARVFFRVTIGFFKQWVLPEEWHGLPSSFHPIDWFLDSSVGARDQQGSAFGVKKSR